MCHGSAAVMDLIVDGIKMFGEPKGGMLELDDMLLPCCPSFCNAAWDSDGSVYS